MSDSPQFSTTGQPPAPKPARAWFKKKRFIIPAVLLVVIIGASAGGSDDKSNDTATGSTNTTEASKTTESTLYPGRADSKKGDKERAIGEEVELSGYTTKVNGAPFQQRLSVIEEDGYIVADVTITNRDDKAQRYSTSDWKLLTPSGTIIDPTFTSIDGALSSADLVKGGSTTGKVPFEVGSTKGDYYLIYDPDLASSNRGIWKVTV